jgi:hypothetical protein
METEKRHYLNGMSLDRRPIRVYKAWFMGHTTSTLITVGISGLLLGALLVRLHDLWKYGLP